MSWTVVSRADCHLCEEMVALLESEGIDFLVVDVDDDQGLRERFGEVVPVLLRDGRPVAKVRVDARRLRRLVRRRR